MKHFSVHTKGNNGKGRYDDWLTFVQGFRPRRYSLSAVVVVVLYILLKKAQEARRHQPRTMSCAKGHVHKQRKESLLLDQHLSFGKVKEDIFTCKNIKCL